MLSVLARDQSLFRGGGGMVQLEGGHVQILLTLLPYPLCITKLPNMRAQIYVPPAFSLRKTH